MTLEKYISIRCMVYARKLVQTIQLFIISCCIYLYKIDCRVSRKTIKKVIVTGKCPLSNVNFPLQNDPEFLFVG